MLRMLAKLAVSGVSVAAMATAGLLSGCSTEPSKTVEIKNDAQFQDVVVESDKPVMVMFTKTGCPPCLLVAPVIDQLAKEYEGRAVVAKFTFLTAFFGVPSPEIKKRYKVDWAPTVILFEHGQPTNRRWIAHMNIDDYRKALDEALKVAPPRGG